VKNYNFVGLLVLVLAILAGCNDSDDSSENEPNREQKPTPNLVGVWQFTDNNSLYLEIEEDGQASFFSCVGAEIKLTDMALVSGSTIQNPDGSHASLTREGSHLWIISASDDSIQLLAVEGVPDACEIFSIVPASGEIVDPVGDVLSSEEGGTRSFVDIVKLDRSITTTSLNVNLTMYNMPAIFYYNDESLNSNTVEYEWRVTFDVNDDGVESAGDIILTVGNVKESGALPNSGSLFEFSNATVELQTGAHSYKQINHKVSFDSYLDGNIVHWGVNHDGVAELSGLSESTRLMASASYFNGTNFYGDSLP